MAENKINMNRRAIAILGAIFILIVGTLGFLIYQRTKKNSDTNTNANVAVQDTNQQSDSNANTNTAQTPPSANATKATDDAVISPILFYQGNGISYFTNSGQLFQTDLQVSDNNVLLSNKHELSIALKQNITKILWPASGNNFIAQSNNNGQTNFSVYLGNKGSYVDLPANVKSIDWMPDGNQIVYVWVDNGKASLFTANADGTGYKKVFDFFDPDNIIDVSPDGQKVLFYRTQTADLTANKIVLYDFSAKTFKTEIADGYNQGVVWSHDSAKFLFNKRDQSSQKLTVWSADLASGSVRSLGLTTSVQKTTWAKDNQTIYAAAPTTSGSSGDTIYKMDTSSLDKQEYQPGVPIDGEDLFLSAGENVLFFRNGLDNTLYYLAL